MKYGVKEVYISENKNGYKHPKCYLSHMGGCSKESKEHLVSNCVLNVIEPKNKTINAFGFPRDKRCRDQIASIGKSDLQSAILCKNHNNKLSEIDSEMAKFFSAIKNTDFSFVKNTAVNMSYVIDGTYIERWVIKTLINLIESTQLDYTLGCKEKLIRLLCSPHEKMPFGWGMYFSANITVHHYSSFELIPKFNPNNGEILGVGLKFNGIEANFLIEKPDKPEIFGLYRPQSLIFSNDLSTSKILFDWREQKSRGDLTFLYKDKYTGIKPEYALLKRA